MAEAVTVKKMKVRKKTMKNTVKQITKIDVEKAKKENNFYLLEQLYSCDALCSNCNHYLSCKRDIKIAGLM